MRTYTAGNLLATRALADRIARSLNYKKKGKTFVDKLTIRNSSEISGARSLSRKRTALLKATFTKPRWIARTAAADNYAEYNALIDSFPCFKLR